MNKKRHHQLAAICIAVWAICLMAPRAVAQNLNVAEVNWGSLDFSGIVDSNGNALTADGSFYFDLGAFKSNFTPTESNVEEWAANWYTFDRATYVMDSANTAVFASSYRMYDGSPGGVDSVGGNFEALGISRDAYIWVYNGTIPEHGTQWFLARSTSWVFPQVTGACCGNNPPLEWSMSDLTSSDVPLWGNQLGTEGPGERAHFREGADLQTYTFIPEPSSALLVSLAGIVMALRRNRQPKAPESIQPSP